MKDLSEQSRILKGRHQAALFLIQTQGLKTECMMLRLVKVASDSQTLRRTGGMIGFIRISGKRSGILGH